MASHFVSFPPRTTVQVPVVPALKTYIATTYGEDPEQYKDDFRTLESMRAEAANPDAHESYVLTLWKYYANLLILDTKFPISETGIRIGYTWNTSTIESPIQDTITNVSFERASILFNIASMYSYLGVLENHTTMEGIKSSAKYFQYSAGVLDYILKHSLEWKFPQHYDFAPETLNCLLKIQLAQAQECYATKAVMDKMKPSVISKLSLGAASLYDQALETSQYACSFYKVFLKAKSIQFLSDSCYRQSIKCAQSLQYGEQVAWLTRGQSYMKKVFESGFLENSIYENVNESIQSDLRQLETILKTKSAQAQKDNDTIYIQPIPKDENLAPIQPALLAEPSLQFGNLELNDFNNLMNNKFVFYLLVPMEVHSQVSEYYAVRDQQVNTIIKDIKLIGKSYDEELKKLGLPGMLDVIEKPSSIPKSVLQNSEIVRSKGGLTFIENQLKKIKANYIKAENLLEQCSQKLKQEFTEDSVYRQQYGSRWVRPPSQRVNESYRTSLDRYKTFLAEGKTEDLLTQENFEFNKTFIEYLCMDKDQIRDIIPKPTALTKAHPEIEQLRPLLKQGEECSKWREDTIKQLKEFSKEDDIAKVFLDLYNKRKVYNKEEVFKAELQKYNNYESTIIAHKQQMESLIRILEDRASLLVSITSNNEGLKAIETVVNNMTTGFLAFNDLSLRLKEGVSFYEKLLPTIVSLVNLIDDFTIARDTEKNGLLAQMNSNLFNNSVAY